jgi:hypothetical protein
MTLSIGAQETIASERQVMVVERIRPRAMTAEFEHNKAKKEIYVVI